VGRGEVCVSWGEAKSCVMLFTSYYVAPGVLCGQTLKFRRNMRKPFATGYLSSFRAGFLLKFAPNAQLQPKWSSVWFESEL
jgi:hypothetical protein